METIRLTLKGMHALNAAVRGEILRVMKSALAPLLEQAGKSSLLRPGRVGVI